MGLRPGPLKAYAVYPKLVPPGSQKSSEDVQLQGGRVLSRVALDCPVLREVQHRARGRAGDLRGIELLDGGQERPDCPLQSPGVPNGSQLAPRRSAVRIRLARSRVPGRSSSRVAEPSSGRASGARGRIFRRRPRCESAHPPVLSSRPGLASLAGDDPPLRGPYCGTGADLCVRQSSLVGSSSWSEAPIGLRFPFSAWMWVSVRTGRS
jgi:hypothetical protein